MDAQQVPAAVAGAIRPEDPYIIFHTILLIIMRPDNALIIFVKYPEPGKVKTRLAADIGEEKAAHIYSLMAKKIIEKVLAPEDYHTFVFYDPPSETHRVNDWLGAGDYELFPQSEGSLGSRIINSFDTVFSKGFKKTIIIGTDCIGVKSKLIREALYGLDNDDVAIGPAHDGGYYLLGLNSATPQIFQDIEWSTESVLKQTLDKVNTSGLGHFLLETLNDIDTIQDITPKLLRELRLQVGLDSE